MKKFLKGVLFVIAVFIFVGTTVSYAAMKNCVVCGKKFVGVSSKCSVCSQPVHTHKYNISSANCTTAKKCTTCGYVAQNALGHNFSAATCYKAKTCTRCNATQGVPLIHNWKDATCLAPRTCTFCGLTQGYALSHDFSAATCYKAKTCTRCNATQGNVLGHNFSAATCLIPKTCTRCRITQGNALGHKLGNWEENNSLLGGSVHYKICKTCKALVNSAAHSYNVSSATCTVAKKCTACGKIVQNTVNHTWIAATCAKPKTCKICGTTQGYALVHIYEDATCTKPKTCKTCGSTVGGPAGHNWAPATCTKDQTCSKCSATFAKALGHNFSAATCSSPATCTRCKTTTGTATGKHDTSKSSWHNDISRNVHYKVCSICKNRIKANGQIGEDDHTWGYATCTKSASCSVCGAMKGTSTGIHDTSKSSWYNDTAKNVHYKICANCKNRIKANGQIGEDGHSFSKATCTEAATCVCGAIKEKALGHKLGGWEENNSLLGGSVHYKTCKTCKALANSAPHTYNVSSATCTLAKKCTVCEKIVQNELGHNWDKKFTQEKDRHYKKCSRCNAISENVNHNWNINEATCKIDKKCTTCEYVGQKADESKHTWAVWTPYQSGHRRMCLACKKFSETKSHTFDQATCTQATKCSVCGYTGGKAIGHNWGTTWQTDATRHYKVCTRCSEKSTEGLHSPLKATCTQAAKCSVCGYTSGKAIGHNWGTTWQTDATRHYKVCTKCNEKTAEGNHAYQNATCTQAAKCSVCGYTSGKAIGHNWRTTWQTDATRHYKVCTRCSEKSTEGLHSPLKATCTQAAKCSVCGYTSGKALGHNWGTTWQTDATRHYKVCTKCNEKTAEGNHAYQNATCTQAAKCSVCGYTSGKAIGHNWRTTWQTDATRHYKVCTRCSEKSTEGLHSPLKATCTQAAKCSVCGYTSGKALGHTAPNADGRCGRCGRCGVLLVNPKETLDYKISLVPSKTIPLGMLDRIAVGFDKAPANLNDVKLTWTSSNPSVAVVKEVRLNKNGEVKESDNVFSIVGSIATLKEGTTNIIAKLPNGQEAKTVLTVKKENLSLSATTNTINVGKESSIELKFSIMPWDLKDVKTTWTSSNPKVATVTEARAVSGVIDLEGSHIVGTIVGNIKALTAGSTTITVKLSTGETATCKVTVTAPEKLVISLNSANIGMSVNEEVSTTLKFSKEPWDLKDVKTTWTSSNPKVAAVSEMRAESGIVEPDGSQQLFGTIAGKIKGLMAGSATITVKLSTGETATCKVLVAEKLNEAVTTIEDQFTLLPLETKESSLGLKGKKIIPELAAVSSNDVLWLSSNIKVATITKGGIATGRSNGEATLTAKSKSTKEVLAECKIVVNGIKQVSSINLNKTELELNVKASETLIAEVNEEDAANKQLTWTTSDRTIATVSSTGKITAKSNGKVEITAKAKDGSEVSATCVVNVVGGPEKVSSIVFDKQELTLGVKANEVLVATVLTENAANKKLTWSSSDKTVAIVTSAGKITAKKEGTAIIIATSKDGSNVSAVCTVTVVPTIKVQEIKILEQEGQTEVEEVTLKKGEKLQLAAQILPDNALLKTVTWKSGSTKVATVTSKGLVTAKTVGTSQIKAIAKDGSLIEKTIIIIVAE